MKKLLIFLGAMIIAVVVASIVYPIVDNNINGYYLNYSVLLMKNSEKQFLHFTYSRFEISASDVEWKSADPEIAEVSKAGEVEAKGFGSTTITATYKGNKRECKVVIIENYANDFTLNYNYDVISVGEEEQINATFFPNDTDNKTLTWTSSNTQVATISSAGILKGVGVGFATITAKTNNNITKVINIEVKSEVAYTSLSLTSAVISMDINTTQQILYSVSPQNAVNKTITWVSSDPTVVEVDAQGKITSKKVGSVTITATAANGTLSATCQVVVPEVDIQGVQITNNARFINIADGLLITTQVNPNNTTKQYTVKYNCNKDYIVVIENSKYIKYNVSVSETGMVTFERDGEVEEQEVDVSIDITVTLENELGEELEYFDSSEFYFI